MAHPLNTVNLFVLAVCRGGSRREARKTVAVKQFVGGGTPLKETAEPFRGVPPVEIIEQEASAAG